jgi:methanogenic corrinoid protein MtbC1
MKNTDALASLAAAIADLREDASLALVRQRLEAGDDPLLIIEDCREGMRRVGLRYERKEYFLAGLIMAGEIFRQVMELLKPVVQRQVSGQASGRILLGTVEGDIHDLGKNIVSMLLSCHNFEVVDLDEDVSPGEFAERAVELPPDIVGLSGLLTSSYDAMRETIALLRTKDLQMPVIIGGGQLTSQVCEYVGADHWSTEAVHGVELCKRLVASHVAQE